MKPTLPTAPSTAASGSRPMRTYVGPKVKLAQSTIPTAAELEQLVKPETSGIELLERELRASIEAELRSEYAPRIAELERELAEERDLNRCISVRDATKETGVSHDFLYKHKKELPFMVQMGANRWVVCRRKLHEFKQNNGGIFESPVAPEVTLGTANRRRSSRPFR